MIGELAVLMCLFFVFIWFWTLEPKYGHHFIDQEPWETQYTKVSDNLADWEDSAFEEE